MELKPLRDKDVPKSSEAERAVLGSVLINNGAYDRVAPIVSVDDFSSDQHKLIWSEMESLRDSSVEIDLLTLKDQLTSKGKLSDVGGSAYISSLVDGIPDVANVERYARLVRQKAILRALTIEGHRLMRTAMEPGSESAEEIAAGSALRLTDLSTITGDSGLVSVRTTVRRANADVEARVMSQDDITGLPFGIDSIDSYTLGIQRGVESVLAARPRVGKTAVALHVAIENAKRHNRTLVIELDMSERMIGKRLLAAESGVSYEKIRSGRFITENEWKLLANAEAALSTLDDWLMFDYETHDLSKLAARVRREARKGLDLVIVDHIGHISGGEGEKRYLQLGDVSRRFIWLAKEANCGWLTLMQTGRDSEQREPYISDLRESGNLEQDARLVVMLDRPALRDEADIPICHLNVLVPKNEGEAGARLPAHFDGDVQRVSQYPTRHCRFCKQEVAN